MMPKLREPKPKIWKTIAEKFRETNQQKIVISCQQLVSIIIFFSHLSFQSTITEFRSFFDFLFFDLQVFWQLQLTLKAFSSYICQIISSKPIFIEIKVKAATWFSKAVQYTFTEFKINMNHKLTVSTQGLAHKFI